MNYLWEAMLYMKEHGIKYSQVRFEAARVYSAYMEVSNVFLNQDEIENSGVLEVNPYYRFFDIFKDLFAPDTLEMQDIRERITNVLLHQLAENDCMSGMTKEQYYKKLLYQDFITGRYSKNMKELLELFSEKEKEAILSTILSQYSEGNSLELFKNILNHLVDDNIVYNSRSNPYEIMIYIGARREEMLEKRIEFIISTFLDICYQAALYFEYHFGIIGVDETMIVDQITMC